MPENFGIAPSSRRAQYIHVSVFSALFQIARGNFCSQRNWKSLKLYDKSLRVYGLLTEPGENTTAFAVFGTEHGVQGVDWIIVTIDLKSVFEREG